MAHSTSDQSSSRWDNASSAREIIGALANDPPSVHSGAPGGVGGPGFALPRAPRIVDLEWEPVGEDLMLTGRVS